MGSLCIKDERSQRLKRRREREKLISQRYQHPDARRAVSNGGLEAGFQMTNKCFRCKCRFNVVTRRHHCRRCKNSFCGAHSARRANAYAILQERDIQDPTILTSASAPMVRVCENCFLKMERSGQNHGESSW